MLLGFVDINTFLSPMWYSPQTCMTDLGYISLGFNILDCSTTVWEMIGLPGCNQDSFVG